MRAMGCQCTNGCDTLIQLMFANVMLLLDSPALQVREAVDI